ncbi:MAG: hypothetical protein JWP89_2915 [Schlesneria sp.]|nr:hypothetical protein [Schlesneria sp.]
MRAASSTDYYAAPGSPTHEANLKSGPVRSRGWRIETRRLEGRREDKKKELLITEYRKSRKGRDEHAGAMFCLLSDLGASVFQILHSDVKGLQFTGVGVVGGVVAVAEGSDDDEEAVAAEADRGLTVPGVDSLRLSHQPLMIVAGKCDSLAGRSEDAIEMLVVLRRTGVIPQIFEAFGIQPRFDVTEQAVFQLQTGVQRGHELKRFGRIPQTGLIVGANTQAVIVIPPDSDRPRVGEQVADFIQVFTQFENVADDDDEVDVLLLKRLQRGPQVADVFMDVGQQAEFHRTSRAASICTADRASLYVLGSFARRSNNAVTSSCS